MLIAAVHLSPLWSIPPAVALSAAMVWYWMRLGREDVPPSRRKIRRFSLAIMLLSLPMFVRALSFADPKVDQRGYVIAWTSATFMLLIVIAIALLDALNNLRLHQEQRHEALHDAAMDLAKAMRERRQQQHPLPLGEGRLRAGPGVLDRSNAPSPQPSPKGRGDGEHA